VRPKMAASYWLTRGYDLFSCACRNGKKGFQDRRLQPLGHSSVIIVPDSLILRGVSLCCRSHLSTALRHGHPHAGRRIATRNVRRYLQLRVFGCVDRAVTDGLGYFPHQDSQVSRVFGVNNLHSPFATNPALSRQHTLPEKPFLAFLSGLVPRFASTILSLPATWG
jgi:hypothetical protein